MKSTGACTIPASNSRRRWRSALVFGIASPIILLGAIVVNLVMKPVQLPSYPVEQLAPRRAAFLSPDNLISALACVTPAQCYTVSTQGTFAQSNDGGSTWTAIGAGIPLPPDTVINDLTCTGPALCIAAGRGKQHQFYATTRDAGKSWQVSATAWRGIRDTVIGVVCEDANTCLGITEDGIQTTNDAGATWYRSRMATQLGAINDIDCPTSTVCMLVSGVWGPESAGGSFARSEDGGRTWRRIAAPNDLPLTAVSCATAQTCLVGGRGGVLMLTDDGGATWQQVNALPFAICMLFAPLRVQP